MTGDAGSARHAQAEQAAAVLRATSTIRERARQLLSRARHGESAWFIVDDGFFETAVGETVQATRRRYPRMHIPAHSRWRHFSAGGVDRKALLDRQLAGLSAAERGHTYIDLATVSVLLDAGAGAGWKYVESATGRAFTRSEGLAVASYHAFMAGLFSSDRNHPLRVDAAGLRGLVAEHLASAFQVSASNPMNGMDGRVVLLRRLGEALDEQPGVFGEQGRPGGLLDTMVSPPGPDTPPTASVGAHDILSQLLSALSGIWPAGNAIGTVDLGDCWRHAAVRGEGLSDGWMPFHKLSQWLAYSLIEPFEWGGVTVTGLDALTGLPEYRNGGLMIDSGLLRLRDEAATAELWRPGDEIIVEWRAITLALLDEVAHAVRQRLGAAAARMPLACVLEGGTWAAGRELAQRLRGGLPPLRIVSDGTVF